MTVAQTQSQSSGTSTAEDAIALLTKDHRDVKKLFSTYQELADNAASAEERLAIAQEICEALTLHTIVEEEIFYPALREAEEDTEDELNEAEVEHSTLKELVVQIKSMDPDEDLYDAKVKVLGEYVDHHAREEEAQMFPKAKAADIDLDGLGQAMKERKEELQLLDVD